jgi:uncharacterized protein (DUF2062 family)
MSDRLSCGFQLKGGTRRSLRNLKKPFLRRQNTRAWIADGSAMGGGGERFGIL